MAWGQLCGGRGSDLERTEVGAAGQRLAVEHARQNQVSLFGFTGPYETHSQGGS